MSKVIFVVLLAMALAATSAQGSQGRLYLFGTNDQLECQKIPFLLCDLVCDRCVCDRRAAQFAECICAQWKPFDEPPCESKSKETAKVTKPPVAKSVGGFIPYPECIEKCDECTICTKNLPVEAQLCYCGKKTETENRVVLRN